MPARQILNPSSRPVVRDDKETLWQLAQIVTSKDVTLNDQLEIAPPSREAHSPVQSRRGIEREELSRTWRWPRPPEPPSLPSSTRMLPYETQRWSTVQPYFPPPPSPPSPPAPPPRRVLAPIDPNIATLTKEVYNLEKENAALKKYVVRQKKALVVVARLHEPPL
ncbi:MAG: hypothetical protein CMK83_01325 [Pseudomonadales bacterium]|nr:hypothetical protein [Pseudomonadales bacterium]